MQLVALVGAVYWWRHLPVPGFAIGALAVLAAVMSVHGDMRPWQKAVWMLLIGAFLVLEFRAIDKDRAEYTAAEKVRRTEEREQFQDIANGINASIKQGAAQFDATISGMKGLLSEETGGNSYIYFDIGGPAGPFEMQIPGVRKGYVEADATPHFVGTFPLHNVFVWPTCLSELPSVDYGTVFPGELGRPHEGIRLQFDPKFPEKDLFCIFHINTSNGSYSQVVKFVKRGNKWTWASRFEKYGHKGVKREFFGPGFPKGYKW